LSYRPCFAFNLVIGLILYFSHRELFLTFNLLGFVSYKTETNGHPLLTPFSRMTRSKFLDFSLYTLRGHIEYQVTAHKIEPDYVATNETLTNLI
jgi:hypothetical protein